MTLQNLKEALLWCFVINYGILVFWFLTVVLHWEWPYDQSAKWFGIPREKVNAINFAGIILYKAGIVLFNLVPYIALSVVMRNQ